MTEESNVTFGEYRLDPVAGHLYRGDAPVALTPKAFALLLCLVRQAGRLVPKAELLSSVWPDVHVGDAVLKSSIRELRKALGDDPRRPLFIETAHRRGYRFVAPVSADGEGASAARAGTGLAAETDRVAGAGCATRTAGRSTSPTRSSVRARSTSSSSRGGSHPTGSERAVVRALPAPAVAWRAADPVRQAAPPCRTAPHTNCPRSSSAWTTCGR